MTSAVDADKRRPHCDWWLSGTPLGAPHNRLMQQRRAAIPWDENTAHELTDAQRSRLGKVWRTRAEAEYMTVSTLGILAFDLAATSAPADILSHYHRQAIDEIRHAELCLRMANIYTGERPVPTPVMSNLPNVPERPRLQQAAANVLLISCVAETYGLTILSEVRKHATDKTTAAVLTAIYGDELLHSRVGWAYLRYAIRVGGQAVIDVLSETVAWAVEHIAGEVERPRPNEPIPDVLRRHGIMLPAEERVVYSEFVRDVLAPGLIELGVDVGTIVEDYDGAWAAKPPPEPDAGS